MTIPACWRKNREEPKCRKCGSRDFTEIGECSTCGEFLLVAREEGLPKTKASRRRIIAAEKWATTAIPKNAHNRCYICGCAPEETLEQLVQGSALSIMVMSMLKGKKEWGKATEIVDLVYPKIKNKEKRVQLLTRTIVRGSNVILPVEQLEDCKKEVEKHLGEGEWGICLSCFRKSIGDTEPKPEPPQEKDKIVGPTFKQEAIPNKDWGEETIEQEEWDDDPAPTNPEDDWDDDWDEDDDDWEEVPIKSPHPSSSPETVEIDEDEEDEFYNDYDDDWDEDEVEVIR